MIVSELIEFLQNMPQDLPVAIKMYSEQQLLKTEDIEIEWKCLPRPDGWVQDYRPDMLSQQYLLFPGN